MAPDTVRGILIGLAGPLAIASYITSSQSPEVIAGTSLAVIALALVWRLIPTEHPLSTSLPWPVFALGALPLVQVLPLPDQLWRQLTSLDDSLIATCQHLGIALPRTWSFQPEATLRSATTFMAAIATFLLARHASSRPAGALGLVAGVVALALWQSVNGLSQYFAGLSLIDGGDIAHGSFTNRGYYAAFLSGSLWLTLGVVGSQFTPNRASTQRLVTGIGACLVSLCILTAIAISLSRAALLVNFALFCGGIVLLPSRVKRPAVTAVAVAAMTLALALPSLHHQITLRIQDLISQGGDPGRLLIWEDTLHTSLQHLVGSGSATFPWAFERSSAYFSRKSIETAHSDYLEWAIEFGPVLAALLAATLVVAVLRLLALRFRTASVSDHRIPIGAAAGAAALLLHAAVDSVLHTPAIATMFGCLLGLAYGAHSLQPQGREHVGTGLLACGLCAATLIIGGALRPIELKAHFSTARQQHLAGDTSSARQSYHRALRACPRAAPAWLALADLARADGDVSGALQFAHVARDLEPFTYRVEWALAGHQFAAGDIASGIATLRAVCQQLADLRPAAYVLALRAGAPLDVIETHLTAPDPYAVGEFLAFLVRTGNDDQLPGAYDRLVRQQGVNLSAAHEAFLRTRGDLSRR